MPTRRRNACRTQRNHVQTIYFRQKKTNEAQQIFDYITKKVLHYDDVIAGKTAADDITPPPQAAIVGMSLIPGDYYKSKHSAVFQEKNGPDFSEAARKNMQTIRKHYNYARTNGTTPTNCRQNNSPKQIIFCTNRQSVTANKLVSG